MMMMTLRTAKFQITTLTHLCPPMQSPRINCEMKEWMVHNVHIVSWGRGGRIKTMIFWLFDTVVAIQRFWEYDLQ